MKIFVPLVVAVLELMSITPGVAATVSWSGAGDGISWSDPNNWAAGKVPGLSDDATIGVLIGNPTIKITAGSFQIHSITTATLLTISGGSLEVASTINLSANLSLSGGTIKGATITASGGAQFSGNGGTLDGVTLGTNLTLNGGTLTVRNGLTLDRVQLRVIGTEVDFFGSQTLGGAGEVVFQTNNSGRLYAVGGNSQASAAVLTIGSGITIHGTANGIVSGYYNPDGIINQGTINADGTRSTVSLGGGSLSNNGTLKATNGGSLLVNSSISITDNGSLTSSPESYVYLRVGLLGNTTTIAVSTPQGGTILNGSGTGVSPQFLEAMSQDLGAFATGFVKNFTFGTLALANNTYVKLVDQSNNAPGTAAEAVYANSIIIPAGCTLDLNGLHVYARGLQNGGTVLNGTINQIADSGTLILGQVTPGTLSSPGELDEWTFFARAGRRIGIQLLPGSTGSPVAVAPQLQWANVQLLDAGDHVLATATDTVAGGALAATSDILPMDGIYKLRINAAVSHSASTGNYLVGAWDVTPNAQSLNLGQATVGSISTPLGFDEWTFSGDAGQQVQFDIVGLSSSGLAFKLTGPNGYVAFKDIASDTGLINLPSSGNYTLTAYGLNGALGKYSFVLNQTSVTPLPAGTVYHGTWAGSGQPRLFSTVVSTANPLSVVLSDLVVNDHTEVYLRLGVPPTREIYDLAANGPGASQNLLVRSASAGTWYVLVYGEAILSAGNAYTLQVTSSPVILTSISTNKAATNASATISLNGAGFITGTQVSFVAADGTLYPVAYSIDLPTQITVSVAAGALPAGTYSVKVTSPNGPSAQLAGALAFQPGVAQLKTNIVLPSALGKHVATPLYVDYANVGTAPMPAPLLILEARNTAALQGAIMALDSRLRVSGFWTSAKPLGHSPSIQILASGATPGILQPGESRRIPIYYTGWTDALWLSGSPLKFSLRSIALDNTSPINWPALEQSLQPTGIASAAWHIMYASLLPRLGSVAGGYVGVLNNAASYLGRLGHNVTDVSKLWGFAIATTRNVWPTPFLGGVVDSSLPMPGGLSFSVSRDFNQSIPGRFRSGPFGLGWSTPWQQRLNLGLDGTVTLTTGGAASSVYQPDSRRSGGYFSPPGDHSTLSAFTGGFLLTAIDGTATVFSLDGSLNYVRDVSGNTITASYVGGTLNRLTASTGATLTFSRNAAGLISSLTDSAGRVTTYSYDASNQHLLSVSGFNGKTTTYTYDLGNGSPSQKALTSIRSAENGNQFFSYDSSGRLAAVSADGGAQGKTIAYSDGDVSITDAHGYTSHLLFDENGLPAKYIDALGHPTYVIRDESLNLIEKTNALGAAVKFKYNDLGLMTAVTDPMDNTASFAYNGPQNDLSDFTDAKGNVTRYTTNNAGQVASSHYPTGRTKAATYDVHGNMLTVVNAAGETTHYTYNANGQRLSAVFPDGSSCTYRYQSDGNILSATDETGTVAFSYEPETKLLSGIAYPDGHSLTFTYDLNGRRSSMVDQSGFEVNYSYDAIGRLATVKKNGTVIVSYEYDAAGRISRKTNGNGTYATYQYDGNGNVMHLVNHASNGVIHSRFDGLYDALNRKTSEGTSDGTWSYTYDRNSQLVRAVFASYNPSSVLNQDYAYSYDSVGKRVRTTINGVTTDYTTNELNQYVKVGSSQYKYDANNNLLSNGVNENNYNKKSQLISTMNIAGTIQFTYNAIGQCSASTSNGKRNRYLVDPSGANRIVAISDDAIEDMSYYVYGNELAAQITGGSTNFYELDPSQSVVGIADQSGAEINAYRYSPFGDSLTSTVAVNNPFTYLGGRGDLRRDESGAFVFQYGTYDSGTGQASLGTSLGGFGVQMPPAGSMTVDDKLTVLSNGSMGLDIINYYGISLFLSRWSGALGAWGTRIGRFNAGFGFLTSYASATWSIQEYSAGRKGLGAPLIDTVSLWISGMALGQASRVIFVGEGLLLGAAAVWWVDKFLYEHPGYLVDVFLNILPDSLLFAVFDLNEAVVAAVNAFDPNELLGPSGYGALNYVGGLIGSAFPYRITFENRSDANAPAQSVTVVNKLDANLDLSTFQLTGIGFGNVNLTIGPNSQHFQKTISMSYNGEAFLVEIEAGIRTADRQVYARFQSLDTYSKLPPADVLTGFLPPENGTGRGQGYISYSVLPKPNLATNTVIPNVAVITFDTEVSIATNQVSETDPSKGTDPAKEARVTIDSNIPAGSVAPLPSISSTNFQVTWSGTDVGAGVTGFDIYARRDDGAWALWQNNKATTSAFFTAQIGHTYAFYAVVRDGTGNSRAAPSASTAPDAQTTVSTVAPLSGTHAVVGTGYVAGSTLTITNTITYTGTLSSLGWQVLLPTGQGWHYAGGSGSEGDNKPAVGATELLEWSWAAVPPSPVTFSYTLNIPPGTSGTQMLAALLSGQQSSLLFQIMVESDPLVIDPAFAGQNQAIAFAPLPAKTFGAPPFALTGTASSGLPVSYSSSNSAVVSITGSTATIMGAGTADITAIQAGNASFAPATSVTQRQTVNKANQSITFAPLPSRSVGDVPFALTATASSGLPISYVSSNPAAATVEGNTVSIVAVGITTIIANQAGNSNFNTATMVAQLQTVAAGPRTNQTITFAPLATKTFGDPMFTMTGMASSGLPVIYTSSNSAVAIVNGNTVAIVGAGTSIIAASQPGDSTFAAAPDVPQTLTVNRLAVTVTLGGLSAVYDGAPKPATATTSPAGLPVSFTYNGGATPPTNPGTYTVVGTVTDPNRAGTASGTETIKITALVRHAPVVNGALDGSVQMLLGENVSLAGGGWISGDLLAPGTPTVQLAGNSSYGGTIDGTGSIIPTGFTVSLKDTSLLRHVVQRTEPIALPTVNAPPLSTGTREVSLTSPTENAGDFATIRNLSLNASAGPVAVPAGTYGSFSASGNSALVLGVAGTTEPLVYNFQSLSIGTLPGNARLQIVGPVIMTVANGSLINGTAGSAVHPEWLTIKVAVGGATISGNVTFNGNIVAPNGAVTLNGSALLNGSIIADRLTINGTSVIKDPINN